VGETRTARSRRLLRQVYAMMLNQVQTQQRLIESQKRELASRKEFESRLAELESRVK